jgi:uncharacterized protein (DUF4415 family)
MAEGKKRVGAGRKAKAVSGGRPVADGTAKGRIKKGTGAARKWKRKDVARGRPLSSLKAVEREMVRGVVGARGPQKAPKKILISIRLSPEVVREFRAMGRGWQVRVDEVLKDWLKKRV